MGAVGIRARAVVVAMLAAVAIAPPLSAAPAAPESSPPASAPVLFSQDASTPPETSGIDGGEESGQARYALLDATTVAAAIIEDPSAAEPGHAARPRDVSIELFDGVVVELHGIEARHYEGLSAEERGDLPASPTSIVWLGQAVEEGAQTHNTMIALTPLPGGGHELWGRIEGMYNAEIEPADESRSGRAARYRIIEPKLESGRDGIATVESAGDDRVAEMSPLHLDHSHEVTPTVEPASHGGPHWIDVLVAGANGYDLTTARRNVLQAQLDSLRSQSGGLSNRRFVIVRHRNVNYTQHPSDMSQDLNNLRIGIGGLSVLHSERNTYGADLVALIVPTHVGGACGWGYTTSAAGSPGSAFSVLGANCIGQFTFGHELGHNLGSDHNPEHAGALRAYSYSFGHRAAGVGASIMSYTSGCSPSCPVRNQFSNPSVSFVGSSTPSGIANARDNARSVTAMGPVIEAYRPVRTFVDVPSGTYYDAPTRWLLRHGVSNGCNPTERLFCPSATNTRAEAITLLWRLAGSPTSPLGAAFSDVPSASYYATATRWARAKGITTGVGGTNNFHPLEAVNRVDSVTFLYRFAGQPNHGTNHGMCDTVPGYAARAVTWAKLHGITTGVNGTCQFQATASVLRRDAGTFVYRYVTTPAAHGAGAIPIGV